MKKFIPWSYQGTFTLTLLSEELANSIASDVVLVNGRRSLVLEGKIRFSNVGYEFRTFVGLPFYFSPAVIVSIRTQHTDLQWSPRPRVHSRICKRCTGSGHLFRPEKVRFIRYIPCTDCGGRGLTGRRS